MIAPITRSLEDGSDYSPDWRHQVVTEYLKKCGASGTPTFWEDILEGEKDVVIRQVVRFHLGSSLIPNAVCYALGCQQHNSMTGAASNIRAMAMAGFTYEQIAAELKTSRRNIFIFCRLYFDVERYIGQETWLESLLRRDFCGGDKAALTRERRLLKVAFHEGGTGLNLSLSSRRPKSSEDVQALADQVRYAVAARALDYVEGLNDSGAPPGPEDFARHLMIGSSHSLDQDSGGVTGDQAAINAWLKEAGERGLFKDGINEVAIAIGGGHQPDFGASRRRSQCLQLIEASSERMDGKGKTVAGADDEPLVPPDDASFQQQQVEITLN